MGKYTEMKARHQKEVNEFPLKFAFNDKQYAEMMHSWGLEVTDRNAICSIGAGGYVQKKDFDELRKMLNRHRAEIKTAISEDTDGTGFIYDMFYTELCDHEYCVTGDREETLSVLGMSIDEINKNQALVNGLALAMDDAMKCGG